MSGTEIRQLVQQFLAMIDDGPSPSDLALVAHLDRLACAVRSIPIGACESGRESSGPPYLEAYNEARSIVSKRFPTLGLYNVPVALTCDLDSADCEVGDAVDDLSDLYLALRDVSCAFSAVSERQALQRLKWSFALHWERHLRNLQFYFWRRALEAGESRWD